MKLITRHECADGSHWPTAGEAIKRDSVLAKMEELNRILPPVKDNGCEFANGAGFVQHSAENVAAFIHALGELIALECGRDSRAYSLYLKEPRGFTGRYLDDGNAVAYRPYIRLCSIDSLNREWGQPFYAANPHRAKQVEWQSAA